MNDMPRDTEVLRSEGGILFTRCIIRNHQFHSQCFMSFKGQKVCLSPPEFISIPTSRGNGFSFKEVEAGWLSHSGNSRGKLLSLNIP